MIENTPQKMFSLWCNEENHKLPVETFARVSKRCAALVKANDYQGAIPHPVSEEVFTAFSLACQLKPFKVTLTNAFELLELAQEWGIPSLEQFVNNYIESKGLKKQDDGDCLGQLIQHLEDDEADLSADIAGVAKRFNDYLRDDRLARIHPEHLFKILMQAEPRHINQQLLINFVMKLFETEPEKAVPLSLRIDFDRLSNSQIEDIFQCREMHEQAIGYFIAEAMSSIRDKQQTDLASNEQKYIKQMQEIREYIVKHRALALAKVEKEFETQTAELNALIEKQQKDIQLLQQIREEQKITMTETKQNYEVTKQKFQRELERQQGIIDMKQRIDDERKQKINNAVDEQIVPLLDNCDTRLNEIDGKDNNRLNLVSQSINEKSDTYLRNVDDINTFFSKTDNQVQYIQESISETKAVFAAKIINDQLKRDGYMRDVTHRFEIFDTDPRLWDLTGDRVEKSEEILKKLEDRVRKSCPLNFKHQNRQSMDMFMKFAESFSGDKSE